MILHILELDNKMKRLRKEDFGAHENVILKTLAGFMVMKFMRSAVLHQKFKLYSILMRWES